MRADAASDNLDPDEASIVLDSPSEALAELLESHGEPADVGVIKAALEGLLPPESWTSWWTRARKNPRVLSSGSGSRPSGLWHQGQVSGQPLRNTVVRMPGPSCRA